MAKVTKQMALDYHKYPRPGKIEVIPTKPYATQADLALAYSPGVAYPCLEIQETPEKAYDNAPTCAHMRVGAFRLPFYLSARSQACFRSSASRK